MRHLWTLGLCLALMGPSWALARSPLQPAKEAACGDHGTSVDFYDSPKEAAQIAKKEGKLVLVLHVSGNFEDPRFT